MITLLSVDSETAATTEIQIGNLVRRTKSNVADDSEFEFHRRKSFFSSSLKARKHNTNSSEDAVTVTATVKRYWPQKSKPNELAFLVCLGTNKFRLIKTLIGVDFIANSHKLAQASSMPTRK